MALARAKDLLQDKMIEEGITSDLQKLNIINVGTGDTPSTLSRSKTQKGYSYFYRLKGNYIKTKVDEKTNTETEVFNHKAVDPTPIIIGAGKFKKVPKGRYIELKNPIVTKRLGSEDVDNGYMMHLFTRDMPLTAIFPEDIGMGREKLENDIKFLKSRISDDWSDTIERFKEGGEYKNEIFLINEAQTKSDLDKFFKENSVNMMDPQGLRELDPRLNDFEDIEAQIYFLSKALLMPKAMPRYKVTGDGGSAPYFYTNKAVLNKTLNYLYKNHIEVWKKITEDMNNIYDYMKGRSPDYEKFQHKSPLYTGRDFLGSEHIDVLKSKQGKSSILDYVLDPGMALMLRSQGAMAVKDVEFDPTGVGFREVKSILEGSVRPEDIYSPACR